MVLFLPCFLNYFLEVYPVLLDFLGCLFIKGPLEFFILSFFLADPRSESLFFSFVACDVVSRLCAWWR